MKKKIIFALALFSISSASLATSLTSMNSAQAKNTLSDKTITTVSAATLNGNIVDNSFTGYFNKDGTMTGKFANSLADGAPQSDTGTWKVQKNGEVCVTWQKWDKGHQKCVTFYKLNHSLLVVGPENKFETVILEDNIQKGNQMPA
jgi:hypothetical protein